MTNAPMNNKQVILPESIGHLGYWALNPNRELCNPPARRTDQLLAAHALYQFSFAAVLIFSKVKHLPHSLCSTDVM